MERSTRHRQVEIFNFSFMDILACVIGMLIFILTVVVISGGINNVARKVQSGTAIADLEQKVRDARQYAEAAANRRKDAEKSLNLAAGEIGSIPGPLDAAARVTALDAEARQLQQILTDSQKEKDQLENQASEIDRALAAQTKLATLQQETARIEKVTLDLKNRTETLTKDPPKGREISYYVPRLRDTQKSLSWIELTGGNCWRLRSDDFTVINLGVGDVEFTKSPLAKGVPIDSIVKSASIPMQSGTEHLAPDQVVITCLVRPDAYEDFRKLRDVAWSKGYSVNWIPMTQNERIILSRGRGQEQ